MSDLFKYLCNDKDAKGTALCNRLYGAIIKKYPTYCVNNYYKRVLYDGLSLVQFYYIIKCGHISVRTYNIYNMRITYEYCDQSLTINTTLYTNFGHYKYFKIYCLNDIYARGNPYNIECYSTKINKKIFINTKTGRCSLIL